MSIKEVIYTKPSGKVTRYRPCKTHYIRSTDGGPWHYLTMYDWVGILILLSNAAYVNSCVFVENKTCNKEDWL